MITMKELCKYDLTKLPKEHVDNLNTLLEKLNIIRAEFGRPMIVTSGYRSLEDHLRIYKQKGITDKTKIPMGSKHLVGAACDILDKDNSLQRFITKNIDNIADLDLWLEDFSASKTWAHIQILPYKSWKPGGSRWFTP